MDIRKLDTYNKSYLQGIERSSQFSYSTQYFWWKKYNTLEKIFCKIFKRCAAHKKKLRILDIGCQIGHDIFKLADKLKHEKIQFEWLGIDINIDFIKVCNIRKKLRDDYQFCKFNFFVGNIEECSLKNEKFDIIICSEVFEHLHSDIKAIKNIHQLLNQDGVLILSTPNIDNKAFKLSKFIGKKIIKNIHNTFKQAAKSEFEFCEKINISEKNDEHINLKKLKDWKKFIIENNFKILSVKRGALFYGSKYIDNSPVLFIIVLFFDKILDYLGILKNWSYNFFLICEKQK